MQGSAVSHAIQPVAHHFPRPDGSRLAEQNQKGDLEGIFRIVLVVQHTTADTHHHRSMSLEQRLKCRLVSAGDKVF
jgi:hypothetical protein